MLHVTRTRTLLSAFRAVPLPLRRRPFKLALHHHRVERLKKVLQGSNVNERFLAVLSVQQLAAIHPFRVPDAEEDNRFGIIPSDSFQKTGVQ